MRTGEAPPPSGPRRGRGRPGGKSLGTGRKLVFSAVTVLFIFAALEGGLRLAGFRYDAVPGYLSFRQEKYLFGEGARTFTRDDVLFWRFNPNQEALGINPQGFRGPPFQREKPPGTFRILCLGGSVTFGLHESRSYAGYLEEDLNAALHRDAVQVYNLGVPGYSSFQGLKLFEQAGLDLDPDLVTVLFGWNDHWLMKSLPDREQGPPPAAVKWLSRSRIYQVLYALYAAFRESNLAGEPSPGAVRVPPGDFEANLEALAALARSRGMGILFITAPTSIQRRGDAPAFLMRDGLITGDTDLPSLHTVYNDLVRKTAESLGAPLADCAKVLNPSARDLMMQDGIHPKEAGHRRMAEVIADTVLKAFPGLLPGKRENRSNGAPGGPPKNGSKRRKP